MTQICITVLDEHGAPVRELSGAVDQVALNLQPGSTFIEGHAAGDWWADGVWHTKPERPSPLATWDWQTHQWVTDADAEAAAAWEHVRAQRDQLLAATDWRVVRAQEQGAPLDSAWIEYRQALRDITQQPDPHNIIWPQTPAAEGSE